MTSGWYRFTYALLTATAAVLILAGTSLAIDYARGTRGDGRLAIADYDQRFAYDYRFYNRRKFTHVFRATNLTPGDRGERLLVIGNDGKRYIRRIALTQDHVENSGFGPALRIQLWDRTTDRCIYPSPRRGEPVHGPCRHWGPWDATSELNGRRIVPKTRKSWRPGERHVIVVRYELKEYSPNSDQGQYARFRFIWKYHG